MTSLILPRAAGWPRAGEARISAFGRQLGCRILLLPTVAGWADAAGILARTGGVGNMETAPVGGVLSRRSAISGVWSDYLQDRGYLDPADGYWWVFRGRLTAVAGNLGGIMARTQDNSTASGWAWQRTILDRLYVYHGGSNWYLGVSMSSLVDGEDHVLLGLWRKAESRLELWRDGALFAAANGITTAPPYAAGQGQIKILASRDTANLVGSASFAAVGVGNLSAGAAAAISGDVGLLFARRRQVLYFDAPAAGPQVRELAGALGISFVLSANLSRGAIFAESAFAGAADEALETMPEWDKSTMLGTTGIGRYLDQAYLRAPLNTDTALYTHADAAPTADYSVETDWIIRAAASSFNTRVGIAGRIGSVGFYSLEYLGGKKAGGTPRFELRRYDNGTGVFTALASYAFDVVATTYRVELRMVGSTISARLDGTQIMSVADTTLTAPGLAGLYGNTGNVGNWRGDNFLARTIAAVAGWQPKYWDGSAWQTALGAKRWDGAAWQTITAAPVVM